MTYPQQPDDRRVRPSQPAQYGSQQPYQQGRPRYDDRDRGGYDDRGYDDRGYDNRGYDNRGYDNRGYDNRGYDDRRDDRQRRPVSPPPAAKKRRVWPWVLLGAVLVPILGFAACTALLGGAISAVDQQRQGGSVAIGETFTYASGLALTVALPVPYDAGNEFIIGPDEQGYEASVTITNGTDQPVGAVLITMNATVNNAPAPRVFDEASLATQDIAPGQQLVVPFRFKVPEGTSGPLQIAVTDTFNEPVFFNAELG